MITCEALRSCLCNKGDTMSRKLTFLAVVKHHLILYHVCHMIRTFISPKLLKITLRFVKQKQPKILLLDEVVALTGKGDSHQNNRRLTTDSAYLGAMQPGDRSTESSCPDKLCPAIRGHLPA